MRYFVKTLLLKLFISSLFLTSGFAASNVSAATSTTYPVGLEPKAVAVADFNNDGKNDLATVNRGAHNVSILLGDGAGNFGAATNFSTGDTFSEPFALAVGDFNNDGKIDVVVSKPNVGSISLLLGDGSGGLGAPANFSVGENPGPFGVGDFNGDNKTDLAIADSGFNNGGVYIMLGTGTGSFGSPAKFTAGSRPRYIAVADFNRDNKSDLAVANVGFNFNKISILLGNGAGGFSAPTDFAVGSSPIGLVVRDFNKDTFLDIAVANTDSHNVSILKGDGQGSFGAATNFPANSFPLSITSGDFDGDGKLDLAVGANSSDARISILRGDDTGQFTTPATFTAGSGPQDLAVGDFTGNGANGVAIANASGNTLSVLIGPFPSVSIGSSSVIEGNNGTVPMGFPLTISGPINQSITIFYSFTNGTATAASDFDSSTAPVTIPPASLTGILMVPVNGDQTFEPDETFTVNISGSVNAFVNIGQGQGTIENDDPVPSITINDSGVVEGNSGFRSIVFGVTLSNPSFQAISFTATTADRTAAAGTDYVAKSAVVNIAPNQVNSTFTVVVNSDVLSEPNETLFVNLTNPVNASILVSQAIGTILDDDPAALVVDGTQRAIALDSVTYFRDPFSFVNTFNFSSDNRNRINFFAVDLNLVAGDVLTVQAEDAQHVNHDLPVEFVGAVPNFGGLSQIVVRLPDNLGTGDFLVSFTLRGVASNKGLITIKP
jgi:FG-GAP-like repeat/Calx-beta domain